MFGDCDYLLCVDCKETPVFADFGDFHICGDCMENPGCGDYLLCGDCEENPVCFDCDVVIL